MAPPARQIFALCAPDVHEEGVSHHRPVGEDALDAVEGRGGDIGAPLGMPADAIAEGVRYRRVARPGAGPFDLGVACHLGHVEVAQHGNPRGAEAGFGEQLGEGFGLEGHRHHPGEAAVRVVEPARHGQHPGLAAPGHEGAIEDRAAGAAVAGLDEIAPVRLVDVDPRAVAAEAGGAVGAQHHHRERLGHLQALAVEKGIETAGVDAAVGGRIEVVVLGRLDQRLGARKQGADIVRQQQGEVVEVGLGTLGFAQALRAHHQAGEAQGQQRDEERDEGILPPVGASGRQCGGWGQNRYSSHNTKELKWRPKIMAMSPSTVAPRGQASAGRRRTERGFRAIDLNISL